MKVEDQPDTAFELPAGYRERKEDVPTVVKCPMCGKEVEPDRAPYKIRNLGPGGETLYFDKKECWERYRKEQEKRERAGQAAVGGPEGGKPPGETNATPAPPAPPAKKR